MARIDVGLKKVFVWQRRGRRAAGPSGTALTAYTTAAGFATYTACTGFTTNARLPT